MITAVRTIELEQPLGVLVIGVLPLWEDRGDAIHLREVALALRARRIAPVMLCLNGPDAPAGIDLPEVRVTPAYGRGRLQLSWNVLGTIAAIRAIRRHKLGAIYSRLDPGMIVGWLAGVLTGVPLVVEMNGIHTADTARGGRLKQLIHAATRLWEGGMYRVARAIVGAPGLVALAHEQYAVPIKKFRPVPLGVNTELFRPRDRATCRRELGLPDVPTITWMGSVARWQGLDTLLQAMVHVREVIPNARLLIVGDGIARPECEQLAAELGLGDAVCFTGKVPYLQVPLYLGAADVCAAAFPGNRGRKGVISALKTVSYLACARPVVTTDMDEMADAIHEIEAGVVAPPDDPQALAAGLITVLREDAEARRLRGERALSLVGYDLTWGAAADTIAACLREVAR
jgi:glycosyltransferase involved in cell wall biosynthesis